MPGSLSLLSQHAKTKNIQYKFSCVNASREVYADREKIEILLFNLISNALKFTPDSGSVEVLITEGENKVNLLVSDTGSGIDSSVGDQIFVKFYQEKTMALFLNRVLG